jgi:hypothetical protein
LKGVMSTKKAFKASNAAGQALKSRVSSLRCNSSIENNTKLRMVRIATARRRRTQTISYQMRSNSVINYVQFVWALEQLVFYAKVSAI